MARWGNVLPDRIEQQELKRKAIIREAARVFSRQGSHGATLGDVADGLGVSKAALYRYVRNKQDLVFACHEEAMEIADRALTEAEASGGTGLEKIHRAMAGYLSEMIAELGVPALIVEENALKGRQAAHIYGLRDDYERRLRALVSLGMQDGSIVRVDPKLAVFMLLGATHWVTKWYHPDGAWGPEEVADALTEIMTRGLAATPAPTLTATLHGAG